MSKVFGFLIVALAMSTSMANAALLATWNFNSGAGGTPAPGITASTSSFGNYGSPDSVSGNNGGIPPLGVVWRTSAIQLASGDVTRGTEFSITNTSTPSSPKQLGLSKLSFNAEALAVANQLGNFNFVTIDVYGSLNGGSFSQLGTASANVGGMGTTQSINLNQVLSLSDTYTIRFVFSGSAITTSFANVPTSGQLDNITLEGSDNIVPEPASMACFAGLFAVGAIRRLRKRS